MTTSVQTWVPIQMWVDEVVLDENEDVPVVWLRSDDGHTAMPVCVGVQEAMELTVLLDRLPRERPLPVEFAARILVGLGADVDRVELLARRGPLLVGRATFRQGARNVTVDCRPSEVLSMSVLFARGIWIDEPALRQHAQRSEGPYALTWRPDYVEYLEGLAPEAFGKFRM